MGFLKNFLSLSSRSVIVALLALGISAVALAAWSGPPGGTPPNNCTTGVAGCDAPINVGPTTQTKAMNADNSAGGFISGYLGANKFLNLNSLSTSPSSVSDNLYNIGHTLYWNGSAIVTGGGVVSGSGTTNYVSKFTNSTTLGNSLIYDNGTNVGIGTAGPGAKLDVNGTLRFSSVDCIAGICPPNQVIRLTPNLHLNSGQGNAVYLNYDNGAVTAGTNELYVCNGATVCPFTVNASGAVNANGGITDSAGARMDAAGGWLRTYNQTGWYNGTYGGGMYMVDSNWVRAYNGKGILTDGALYAGDYGNFCAGDRTGCFLRFSNDGYIQDNNDGWLSMVGNYRINGSPICTQNGTGCPGTSLGGETLQAVTARGNSTTLGLDVAGAAWANTNAYTYITLHDDESPNGVKYIHANGNVIGFLSGQGGWIFNVDNSGNANFPGSVNSSNINQDVRSGSAPSFSRFYDSENGAYYTDPSGTSRLADLSINSISNLNGGTINNLSNGVQLGGNAAVGLYSDGTNLALRTPANGGTVYIQGVSGSGGNLNVGGSITSNNVGQDVRWGSWPTFNGFTDSDNGAYQVDPTGTTNIAFLSLSNSFVLNQNRMYLAGNGDTNHYIEMNNSIAGNVTRIHEVGITFLESNQVGIGIQNPVGWSKLDVAGTIHTSGDMAAEGELRTRGGHYVCNDDGTHCPGVGIFGGMFEAYTSGVCQVGNPWTGGCSCPSWAGNWRLASWSTFNGSQVGTYYCTSG